MVSRTAFSTDSLEKLPIEEGVSLIRKAYDIGVNFYHIANESVKSKETLGYAFHGMRKEIFISVASSALENISLQQEIITTLDSLNSSYIDIFSIHNNSFVPKKNTLDGLYTTLLSAKADENIKAIGFSTNNLDLANEALESELYDLIILNVSLDNLIAQDVIKFSDSCRKKETSLIVNYNTPISEEPNLSLIFGFLRKSENIIPLWNITNQNNLQTLINFEANLPQFSEEDLEKLNRKQDSN
jgi:diketogulonate reductase-like aldo/keto reductase